MGKPYLELSYLQVGLAALLILINGAVSVLAQARSGAPALARRGLHGGPACCSSGLCWNGSSGWTAGTSCWR